MASKEYLMALDAGSGGGKCFIVDLCGHPVASAFIMWVRNDWTPELGWDSLCKAARDAMRKARISGHDIVGVSSCSMREETVFLDKQGKELSFAVGPEIVADGMAIEKKLGEEMYLTSGHWPSPMIMLPSRLEWLRKHRPETFSKIGTILMINDWVLYKLSGETAVEPSGACETCLLDIKKTAWSDRILDELGFPADIFPRVAENCEVLGEVTEKAAKETGLRKGTPVVIGGADTQCGLIGTAAINASDTTAVAGTTTPVQMVTDEPVFDKKWRTWTDCHAVPGRWILESNAGLTGWAYRWAKEVLGDAEQIAAKALDVSAYEIMNREAELASPGSGGVMASLGPAVMDARHMTLSTGALVGLAPYRSRGKMTGKKEIFRAIMENTCYAVRANCEQVEEVTGIGIETLRFCGGQSNSKLWGQIQSDVLGVPTWIPEVKDATPFGACLCAGVGAGVYRDIENATKEAVRWELKLLPNEENHKTYNNLQKKWVNTYDTLKGLVDFMELMKLSQEFFKKEG